MAATPADLYTTSYGSIIRIVPASPAGQTWMDEHIHAESWQIDAEGGIVCDPRCAVALLHGALADGLALEDTRTGLNRAGLNKAHVTLEAKRG